MKRRFFVRASTLGLTITAIVLTSCSTPQTRISEHPDLYQSLSPRDQALVSQGQIRIGMSEPPYGWRGGRPIEKLWATWAVARQKPGFTLITLLTHTIRITPRGTSISGRLCTIRFLIRGSRPASLILASSLLSPTAKRCRSNTSHRIRPDQKFCRVAARDERVFQRV
jgi:hypothetical protein